MLDPKLLRTELDRVAGQLARRGFTLDTKILKELESRRRELQVKTQELQAERNKRSRDIGRAKAAGEDIAPLLSEVEGLGERLKENEAALEQVQQELNDILMGIPNIPHESVPEGNDEDDNLEVRRWGKPVCFDFEARDHVDLGAGLGLLDFEVAARLAGSRFAVMRGSIARLHRALNHFMLDVHTREHGYQEVYVPYLSNADCLRGTGQLPKFGDELFVTRSDPPWYLIPTAEVPVTNLVREEIIEAQELPLRFVAHTP